MTAIKEVKRQKRNLKKLLKHMKFYVIQSAGHSMISLAMKVLQDLKASAEEHIPIFRISLVILI